MAFSRQWIFVLFLAITGCSGGIQPGIATVDIRPSPTSTPTQSRRPEQTPLPALTSEAEILDFISFVGMDDCQLPCWANITPGKTEWDEVVYRLKPMELMTKFEIATGIKSVYGEANVVFFFWDGREIRVDGDVGVKAFGGNKAHLIAMNIQAFTYPTETNPSRPLPLPEQFSLRAVLREYGAPSLAFDYSETDDPEPLSMNLLLVYPEKHFYVKYIRHGNLEGENFVACEPDYYMELLVLDDPGPLSSFEAISQSPETKSLYIENWKPLDNVLGMTLEEFSTSYLSLSSDCIIFPKKNWR